MNDEIVKEVRRQRMQILESFDWDVEQMMRAMMAKQGSSGHRVVTLPRKKPQRSAAPNAYPPRGQA